MKIPKMLLTIAAALVVGFGATTVPVVAQADVVTTAQQLYSTPGVHLVNGRGIPAAAPARNDVPSATTPVPVGVAKPTRPVTPAPSAPSGGVKPISRNTCPSSAPIKGNADSGIYHKPGQRFYAKTNPEVCFATDGDAVRAGFRKSKV